jgi:hypothetical protein
MQLKGVQLRPLIPKLALARGVHVRAAPAAPTVADSGLARRQQPVHLRRAHRQNTPSDISPKPSVFVFLVGKPLGQQRLEPFATQLLGHLPNPPQHLLHLAFEFGRTPFARGGVAAPAAFGAQPLDGGFAAVAPLFAECVNQERTPLATRPL